MKLTFHTFIDEANMANGAIKIPYTFYSKIEKRYYNLTWFLVLFVNCTLVQILATETNIWYVMYYEILMDIHIC